MSEDMQDRARIPVSLPHRNPTTSDWLWPPGPLANHRSTPDLPPAADTVIIGSGLTGGAVAWNLLSAPPNDGDKRSIVMLEARQACSGATGRNGGHTKTASYRSFARNAAAVGVPEAVRIARLEDANMRAMHSFVAEHGIECESRRCRTVDVFYDQGQFELAKKAIRLMADEMGAADPVVVQYEVHESVGEVRERFLVEDLEGQPVVGAVSYDAGSMSAYEFVTALLHMCLDRGMQLHTGTPVTELIAPVREDGVEGWTLRTPRGDITARRVVLATNGYSAHLVPQLQGIIVPLRGQVTAQRPGRGLHRSGCVDHTYSFIYAEGYEYMVTRPAQALGHASDIVIGGGLTKAPKEGLYQYGNTDDSTLEPAISSYLREAAARYFGRNWGNDDREGRVRAQWTGIMGYSADGFPLVGELPWGRDKQEKGAAQGLWMSCSFQGHGMVLCWLCAKALAEMMTIEGRDEHGHPSLDSWFPASFRVDPARLKARFAGRRLPTPVDATSQSGG